MSKYFFEPLYIENLGYNFHSFFYLFFDNQAMSKTENLQIDFFAAPGAESAAEVMNGEGRSFESGDLFGWEGYTKDTKRRYPHHQCPIPGSGDALSKEVPMLPVPLLKRRQDSGPWHRADRWQKIFTTSSCLDWAFSWSSSTAPASPFHDHYDRRLFSPQLL